MSSTDDFDLSELSIDDVLSETPPEKATKAVVKPTPAVDTEVIDFTKVPPEILNLRDTVQTWTNKCRDMALDLRTVKFKATDEDLKLLQQDTQYEKDFYFKADPQTPKDPKVVHAQKQFCKIIGIPYGFFAANRPTLKENIVRTWQSGLNAQEEKGKCIIRARETQDCYIIRAILPPAAGIPLNHELISAIMETVKEPLCLEFANGALMDDLVLHARFYFEKEYPVCGVNLSPGFSLIASELGAQPLTIETFLMDRTAKTSYIVSYGGDSFFKTKGSGIRPQEIKEILRKLVDRVFSETGNMLKTVEETVLQEQTVSVDEACGRINRIRGLSAKFKRSIYHEVTECRDEIHTALDFAKHVCLVAKDFDSLKRIAIEQAAGIYLNLIFPKS